jgi:dipeptidyl aminopeptidase/acylaminoacyl peptidase
MCPCLFLSCLSLLAATLPAQTADPEAGKAPTDTLQLMDVFELEHCADPRISSDGERVVFVRRAMDVMTDSPTSRLWIIGTAQGSEGRPLTQGEFSETSPRWSPDGTKLAYVSSEAGSSQIHVRWMDTGASSRLTQLTKAPGSLAWSPDGHWLAFTMFVPKKSEPLVTLPPKPEGAQWADPPVVIESVRYRADGAGYLEQGNTHVFTLPAQGGTPRQLTHDAHDYRGPLTWSADGAQLIVSANRRADHELEPVDSELWELSLADGRLRALTSRFGPDASPAVSPDGSHIAYVGFDDSRQGYQVSELYVMARDGSEPHSLTTTLDRSVQNPTWSADGSGLFFAYDDHGDTRLAFVSLDGELHILDDHLGGLSLGRPYGAAQFTVADNGRYAFTHTAPDHPADLAIGMRGETNHRRLTHLNDDLFAFRTPGEVEPFWADSSFDGRPVQGWIVKPPHFDPDQSYPLLLEIHGGPFANYGRRFSMECQLYAAAGYVVVYTNPRGSTSYGGEFGNLIHHAYPGNDYDDLMSCVDAVIAEGYVDTERLFVTGGSGGGVLTAWIVGKTDRFRAAVVAKPVINWTSFTLTADAYPFFTRYWFPGMPWEVHDQYWKRSPLSLVGNVVTPTMLLTGESDYRTPISESEQYYQALKLRGVDTAMVRIPGSSHGIASKPSRLIAKVAHILAWFERHDVKDLSEAK